MFVNEDVHDQNRNNLKSMTTQLSGFIVFFIVFFRLFRQLVVRR